MYNKKESAVSPVVAVVLLLGIVGVIVAMAGAAVFGNIDNILINDVKKVDVAVQISVTSGSADGNITINPLSGKDLEYLEYYEVYLLGENVGSEPIRSTGSNAFKIDYGYNPEVTDIVIVGHFTDGEDAVIFTGKIDDGYVISTGGTAKGTATPIGTSVETSNHKYKITYICSELPVDQVPPPQVCEAGKSITILGEGLSNGDKILCWDDGYRTYSPGELITPDRDMILYSVWFYPYFRYGTKSSESGSEYSTLKGLIDAINDWKPNTVQIDSKSDEYTMTVTILNDIPLEDQAITIKNGWSLTLKTAGTISTTGKVNGDDVYPAATKPHIWASPKEVSGNLINLEGGTLNVGGNLVIDGCGKMKNSVITVASSSTLNVNGGSTLEICNGDGKDISNNNRPYTKLGGGIYNEGAVTTTGDGKLIINKCRSYWHGGGIYTTDNGYINILCDISECYSTLGGGISIKTDSYSPHNSFIKGGSNIHDNHVKHYLKSDEKGYKFGSQGAGIYINGKYLVLNLGENGKTVNVKENTADTSGGGIHLAYNSKINVIGTVNVEDNNAHGQNFNTADSYLEYGGGGIFIINSELNVNSGAVLNVKNCKAIKKEGEEGTTNLNGGGINVAHDDNSDSGKLVVNGQLNLNNNHADQNGGGIYNAVTSLGYSAKSGTVTVESGGSLTVSGNTATENGGGIYNAMMNVKNTDYLAKFTVNSIDTLTVSGNTATENGGGIYNAGTVKLNYNSAESLMNSIYNNAAKNGGGIWSSSSDNVYYGWTKVSSLSDGDIKKWFKNKVLRSSDPNSAENGENYCYYGMSEYFVFGSDSNFVQYINLWAEEYYREKMLYDEWEILYDDSNEWGMKVKSDLPIIVSGNPITISQSWFNIEGTTLKIVSAPNYHGRLLDIEGSVETKSNIIISGSSDNGDAVIGRNSALVYIGTNGKLNINDASQEFKVENGNRADGNGGGIENKGIININQGKLTVSNNKATNGGGIYNDGTITIGTPGTLEISNNEAKNGGGLYNAKPFTFQSGSIEIKDNSASERGGGLYNANGVTLIINNDLTISNNEQTGSGSSEYGGGGIYNAGNIQVYSSKKLTVYKNTAVNGGGIYNNAGKITADSWNSKLIVSGNTAVNGGGIFKNGGTITGTISYSGNTPDNIKTK